MNSKSCTANRTNLLVLMRLGVVCLFLSQASQARNVPAAFAIDRPLDQAAAAEQPCYATHGIGQLVVHTGHPPNIGGTGYWGYPPCQPGTRVPSGGSEYPKGSNLSYLYYATWWIGAVVGEDTLVSTYWSGEFLPEEYPNNPEYRSTTDPESPEYDGAISEEDYIGTITDTIIDYGWTEPDFFGMRRHKPLGIEITGRSSAWSYGYAEDFILFQYDFQNIGGNMLSNVYIGLEMESVVHDFADNQPYVGDDLGGFLKTAPSPLGCGLIDTLNMVWVADNDGDPNNEEFQFSSVPRSVTAVTGVRVLSTPTTVFGDQPNLSYNWWIHSHGPSITNFGPRQRKDYRDFRTGGLGEPSGDVNRYYIMRHPEIDYDPAFTATIRNLDEVWLYPNQEVAVDVADGRSGILQLLSFGPFDIPPGASMPITFAFVAGEDFHTNPENLANLPYNPTEYYENLDFSDLVLNSMYASWIYDNPGVDTDDDGNAGKFVICAYDSIESDSGWIITAADTVYYAGDGVADWRAAGPPPAPKVWLEPLVDGVRVRFNGMRSETERDIFTRLIDFEGYRVYFGRDERLSSYAVVASYDRQDYDKFVWMPRYPDGGHYQLRDVPYTLDSLRCLYGAGVDPCDDEEFNPLLYPIVDPYKHPRFPDSMFYFARHDFNVSDLGLTTPIRKVYPNEPDPSGQAQETFQPDQFTDDGYLKFYEYEFIIKDLLPSVSYWINVTAFDFGSPESRLAGLETSITLNAQMIFPYDNESAATVATDDILSVYVYPNPYRINGNYRANGYEGRTRHDLNNEKVRAIRFAHLPPKCTITIYSIDGDLVDYIEHDMNPNDPNSSHRRWDLISRNHEAVVSGLYFWTVETPSGQTQLGKLSIIM